MSPSARRVALAAGDAGAIVVFVVVGLMSHEEGVTTGEVIRVAVPILALWFGASAFLGTYRRPGLRTLLPTWLVAVIGGVLIRYAIYHRPENAGKLFIFLGVALAFTLLLLLAWRLAARFLLGVGKPADAVR